MNDTHQNTVAERRTVAALLTQRQAQLGLSDDDLAAAAGYAPNVIALMKAGTMRMPVNKVKVFAAALKTSHAELLGLLMAESAPELWGAIRELLPLGDLTGTEVNLIRHVRKLTKGREAAPLVLDGAGVIALVMAGR